MTAKHERLDKALSRALDALRKLREEAGEVLMQVEVEKISSVQVMLGSILVQVRTDADSIGL